MVLLHQRFQRASRRNKDFSGRGASPSAPCMTWFSLLFSSFFLSLSFLGARSQQPPAPRRQPEFQQIRAVFCWGIFVVAGAAGFVLCVLILHVAEGFASADAAGAAKKTCLMLKVKHFASADATKGHENKRSLRSPFGNLRAPMLLDFHCCFWARLRTRFICIPHSAFLIANFPLLPPVPLHRKKQTWYDNQTNRQGRIGGWTRRAGSSC